MLSFFHTFSAVTEVAFACRVPPGKGDAVHRNRPFHGLALCTGGIADYRFSDGTVLRVRAGDLIFLPKYSDYVVDDVVPGTFYAVNFQLAGNETYPPAVLRPPYAPMLSLFRRAEADFRVPGRAARYRTAAALNDILALLAEEDRTPNPYERALAPALRLANARYHDPTLRVADLARSAGVSEVYLRRLFRAALGTSPYEYLLSLRLARAKVLLASGECSVGAACELSGFGDVCSFSRAFRRAEGCSPAAFRKNHANL